MIDPEIAIRYACRCGHLAPLNAMFFSELCQKLVCRGPSCSIQEFESYYCGHLLVNLPSKEANLYQNRSSRCFACVACETVLSTVFDAALSKYFFVCAHCHWDSQEIGLLEDDPDTLMMTAVARERETPHEDVFHTLLSHHTATSSTTSSSSSTHTNISSRRFSSAALARSASLTSFAGTMKEMQREQQMKKSRLQRMVQMGSWKYEHALARVHEREAWLAAQRHEHEWPALKHQLAQVVAASSSPVDTQPSLEVIAANGDMGEITTLTQRLLVPLDQPRDARQLYPHRPLLRVKRTWRCVESIERGSAGILVKPQISPMSGDSSLSVPAAWFKKANLARQFVPVITFQSLPKMASVENDRRVECVLLIENPLDDAIQIICQSGSTTHTKVLLEDATPIVLGAYEDPSLADAFADDASATDANTRASRNRHLLSSTRNLAKVLVPLAIGDGDHGVVFRLQIEMTKLDEPDREAIMGSLFSFTVEFAAPLCA